MGFTDLFKPKPVKSRECCPLSCKCGKFYVPQRILAIVLTFIMVTSAYMNRVLFIFVVPQLSIDSQNDNISDALCPPRIPMIKPSRSIDISKYEWDPDAQSLLIGAYFYGYPLLQIVSGYVVTSYGAKWTLSLGLLISSLCTCCMPFMLNKGGDGNFAYWGSFMLITIQGAAEGLLFCNISSVIAGWVPKEERGTLGYFVLCAPHIGTFIGFFTAGKIIAIYGAWKELFYAFATVSMTTNSLFIIFTHSNFERHPYITDNEYDYLKENMTPMSAEKIKIPCKRIVRSMPFWALLLTSLCHDFGFFSIQNELPKYMKIMLKFNTDELSIFTSVPYLLTMLVAVVGGTIADNLLKSGRCSITALRKTYIVLGVLLPASFALAAPIVECNDKVVVVMFMLGVASMGFYAAGWANYCDLSPVFAAFLTSIANTVCACQGFISSILVSTIVGKEPTFEKWEQFMGLVFASALVACVLFLIFGSGKRQQWDIDAVGEGGEGNEPTK